MIKSGMQSLFAATLFLAQTQEDPSSFDPFFVPWEKKMLRSQSDYPFERWFYRNREKDEWYERRNRGRYW